MNAIGDFAGGVSAYDAGKYTRRVMKINAANTLNDGVAERDRIRYVSRETMGQQIVGQAGSGFQLGTGTALDALRQSATNRELDLMTSRRNALLRSQGFKQEGDLAYAKGYSGLVGGVISGAVTIMNDAVGAFGGGGGAPPMAAAGGGGGGINVSSTGTSNYFAAHPFGGG